MTLFDSAMNITFLCKPPCQICTKCRTPSFVSGEEIDISAELFHRPLFSDRVVKAVPNDRVLLLDNCRGGRLKSVSDDCRFVIPTNDGEWELAKPMLMALAERQVFVLREISHECHELLEAKEKCRKSFYSPSDGMLINRKFERDNLSPEKMAEAGFMFVGDASTDTTICFFKP